MIIKNIFIPEKINNYYIFSKTIVGIDISRSDINFCVTKLKGRTTTIINQFTEKIDSTASVDYLQRVQVALTAGMAKIKHYDEIRTALSSSVVIYKYLTLPFIKYEKIKMILPLEIESMLPFALNSAIIDFIILETNKEKGVSSILVTAVQKNAVEKHLELFNNTAYTPTVITVDMINLYNLYLKLHQESSLKNIVLLDLGWQTTTIGIVSHNILKFVRNIQQGISHIAKGVGNQLNIAPQQAMENIIRFGANKDDASDHATAAQDAITKFWNTINFTLSSFAKQLDQAPLEKVYIVGDSSIMKDIIERGTSHLNIPCEWLSINSLATTKNMSIKHKDLIPNSAIMSVATALPYQNAAEFNLRQMPFELPHTTSFIKLVLVALILTVLIVGSLFTNLLWQTISLRTEKEDSQLQVIKALKNEFPTLKKKSGEEGEEEQESLDDQFDTIIKDAESALKTELETLFKFSTRSRASMINYLFELTQRIDKKALGFNVERITINDKDIILKAHVRDEHALKVLEKSLGESELFIPTPQQHPDFTMRIILKHSLEDNI